MILALALAVSIHAQVQHTLSPSIPSLQSTKGTVGLATSGSGTISITGTESPEAKPTDGTEPTFTTEPVTQQVPHCKPWEKLKEFEGAVSNGMVMANPVTAGDATTPPYPWISPAQWFDVGNTDDFMRLGRIFRCFEDERYHVPPKGEDCITFMGAVPVGIDCAGPAAKLLRQQEDCALFDKDGKKTEDVKCDDPRIKWPTSATVTSLGVGDVQMKPPTSGWGGTAKSYMVILPAGTIRHENILCTQNNYVSEEYDCIWEGREVKGTK